MVWNFKKNRASHRRILFCLFLGVFLTLLMGCCYRFQPRFLRHLDLKVYDLLLASHQGGTPSPVPVLVDIDEKSLAEQLAKAGAESRSSLPFHKMLLNGELPLTIGGGIGQSRLCMLLLGKAHIGEVQCSIWDEETLAACRKAGIPLL